MRKKKKRNYKEKDARANEVTRVERQGERQRERESDARVRSERDVYNNVTVLNQCKMIKHNTQ